MHSWNIHFIVYLTSCIIDKLFLELTNLWTCDFYSNQFQKKLFILLTVSCLLNITMTMWLFFLFISKEVLFFLLTLKLLIEYFHANQGIEHKHQEDMKLVLYYLPFCTLPSMHLFCMLLFFLISLWNNIVWYVNK